MEISIKGIPLVRGKSHCEKPIKFSIRSLKELQISKTLRGRNVKVFDRGNLKTVITFENERRHSTIEEAERFAMTHAMDLSSASGDAIFGSYVLKDASVRLVESSLNGVVSTHRYEIFGSKLESKL